MVPATENFIGDFFALTDITNDYLFAFSDHDAIDSSGVVSRS
jgi:hypothetical protein